MLVFECADMYVCMYVCMYVMCPYNDANAVRVGIVLQNDLLQEVEGPLVADPLTHLHHRMPSALSVRGLAILALLVADSEIDHCGLVKVQTIYNIAVTAALLCL